MLSLASRENVVPDAFCGDKSGHIGCVLQEDMTAKEVVLTAVKKNKM